MDTAPAEASASVGMMICASAMVLAATSVREMAAVPFSWSQWASASLKEVALNEESSTPRTKLRESTGS